MPLDPYTVAKSAKESFSLVRWVFHWLVKNRYPKAPRNKLGFAVAIYTDGSIRREQITHDFIRTLEELLGNTELDPGFVLVDIPSNLAEQIKTLADATRVMEKTRCGFVIYGRARLRNRKKKPTYVLDLHSAVGHATIPNEISQRLSKEMAELLPARRFISSDNDLAGFEINAASINVAVQYIIATAALVSGESEYARRLFKQVQQQLSKIRGEIPPTIRQSLKMMRLRIPPNLAASHVFDAMELHHKWRKSRDNSILDMAKHHLDQVEQIQPNFYDAWLMRTIYWFSKGRDLKAARAEVNKCRTAGIKDPTWRLSDAFLLAYSGKLIEALRVYRVAAKLGVTSSTWLEVEEFIMWVVHEEPDKTQLHFCLGVINYVGKGDGAQARRDFEEFLSTTPDGRFLEEKQVAQQYLDKIATG